MQLLLQIILNNINNINAIPPINLTFTSISGQLKNLQHTP